MNIKRWGWTLLVIGLAAQAPAQVLDLPTGRTADLLKDPRISVEGGFVAGDVDNIGARGNFRLAERLVVGANLGSADYGDNELTAGAFAIFQLGVNTALPVALKAGMDTTLSGDADVTDFCLEGIVSGPIAEAISWYANAGFHFVQVDYDHSDIGLRPIPVVDHRMHKDDDDDIVPALGGGAVFTINKNASAFVGVDLLLGDLYDDTVIGAGFRWSFN
jgi:hypothetical protein